MGHGFILMLLAVLIPMEGLIVDTLIRHETFFIYLDTSIMEARVWLM